MPKWFYYLGSGFLDINCSNTVANVLVYLTF